MTEPVLCAVAGCDIGSQTGHVVQLRAVVEHLLIAVLHECGCRQFGRLLDALTAVEHILIAALLQGGGGQHEFTLGAVHEFLCTSKEAVEGIVGLDGVGIGKIILTFQQAHHVTVDLGLHRRFYIDVLRTCINSCKAAGCSHSTLAK